MAETTVITTEPIIIAQYDECLHLMGESLGRVCVKAPFYLNASGVDDPNFPDFEHYGLEIWTGRPNATIFDMTGADGSATLIGPAEWCLNWYIDGNDARHTIMCGGVELEIADGVCRGKLKGCGIYRGFYPREPKGTTTDFNSLAFEFPVIHDGLTLRSVGDVVFTPQA